MDTNNVSSEQMDDMASEYLTSMYESQYDDDQSDGNPHTKPTETDRTDEDLPF